MSWSDIAEVQFMFQLQNKLAEISSSIFKKIQLLFTGKQFDYNIIQ
jgi:hypothetical protein